MREIDTISREVRYDNGPPTETLEAESVGSLGSLTPAPAARSPAAVEMLKVS